MRLDSLGGHKNIRSYVEEKLRTFSAMEKSFASLFAMMFSEKDNILYERSDGYRIVRTTYGEAEENVLRRAAGLRSLAGDLPADAVVGLYMDNGLAWIETFWAILCAGFRPLLMNPRLEEETLLGALEDGDAAAVISDGKTFPLRCLSADDLRSDAPFESGTFGTEVLVMSSGTSGHVKLCAYTAEAFYYLIRDSFQLIRKCRVIKRHYQGHLKLLAFLPFYHIFGLVALYIWFGFFSRTFVHLNDMAPQTILSTIRRHQVTHIFAVPLFWNRVYDQAVAAIRDRGEDTWRRFSRGLTLARRLSCVPPLGALFSRLAFREVRDNLFGESISFMITGGSCIRTEVLAFFNGIGYRLANGYGMSEIGITSVELSARSKWADNAYVGKPFSSVEYRIDEAGELLVRSKASARYVREGQTVLPMDGWYATRDLAVCRSGHYQVLGRADELVVGETGENLNPNRIESRFDLSGTEGVCLLDADGPVLLVSVRGGLTEERFAVLRERVRDRLGELGLTGQIGKIVYVSEPLLRPEEFKLNRRRLAEEVRAGTLKIAVPAAVRPEEDDEGMEDLRDAFAAVLGKTREEIDPDGDFFTDLGGSSLDYFALLSALEERYGVSVSAQESRSLSTVRALYAFLKESVR